MRQFILFTALVAANLSAIAQGEQLKYADFEQWITRSIKESALMGGHTQTLYEIGPTGRMDGAQAFQNQGGSPWAKIGRAHV